MEEDAAFAAPAPASSSAIAWRPSQIVPVGVAAAAKVASETQIVNSAGGVFLNDSVRDAIVDMGVGDTVSEKKGLDFLTCLFHLGKGVNAEGGRNRS